MNCANCQAELAPDVRFCPACGAVASRGEGREQAAQQPSASGPAESHGESGFEPEAAGGTMVGSFAAAMRATQSNRHPAQVPRIDESLARTVTGPRPAMAAPQPPDPQTAESPPALPEEPEAAGGTMVGSLASRMRAQQAKSRSTPAPPPAAAAAAAPLSVDVAIDEPEAAGGTMMGSFASVMKAKQPRAKEPATAAVAAAPAPVAPVAAPGIATPPPAPGAPVTPPRGPDPHGHPTLMPAAPQGSTNPTVVPGASVHTQPTAVPGGLVHAQPTGAAAMVTGTQQRDQNIGRVVSGKFQIEELIGVGGMGRVYKAKHLGLDKTVCLKMLRKGFEDDSNLVARFQREAKSASRLDHPNSIAILDFGQDTDGTLFIAMEFLAGQDLARVLRREFPLGQKRIVHIVAQVLSALAEAHERGIIHRDLKPENIVLIKRQDDPDFVKVLDFGIAKIQDGGPALTQTEMMVGTPAYMSPEQIMGEPLDARSDIYAMGVILYQLCTGYLPFEGENPVNILMKHLKDEPVPPRQRRPDAEISEAMQALILRSMAKDKNLRPSSAAQMRAELLALEDGGSTEAITKPEIPRAKVAAASATTSPQSAPAVQGPAPVARPQKSRAPIFAAAAGLVVVIGVGAGLALRPAPEPATAQPPAAVSVAAAPSAPPVAPGAAAAPAATPATAPAAGSATAPAAAPPAAPVGAAAVAAAPLQNAPAPPPPPPPAPGNPPPTAKATAIPVAPKRPPRGDAVTSVPAPGANWSASAASLLAAAPPPVGEEEEGPKRDTSRAEKLVAAGDEKLAADDIDGAIRNYTAATRADPEHAEAHKKLGKALFRKGDKKGAVRSFKKYLAAEPNAPDARQIQMIVKQFDRQ